MIIVSTVWLAICVWIWICTGNCWCRAVRKTKSNHGSGCGWGDDFSEKKESRNISLPSFFSHRPSYITTATVTVLILIDHRELTPLSGNSEGILPILDLRCFFSSPKRNLFVGYPVHSLHSCTVWFFLSLPLRHITPLAFLTLWHFESVQECKVCMGVITEIYADTAALSAFSAPSNFKMRIMQVMQMFFFSSPQPPINSAQSYIYTPILNQTKIGRWWPMKKKNPPMRVGEFRKCQRAENAKG